MMFTEREAVEIACKAQQS